MNILSFFKKLFDKSGGEDKKRKLIRYFALFLYLKMMSKASKEDAGQVMRICFFLPIDYFVVRITDMTGKELPASQRGVWYCFYLAHGFEYSIVFHEGEDELKFSTEILPSNHKRLLNLVLGLIVAVGLGLLAWYLGVVTFA